MSVEITTVTDDPHRRREGGGTVVHIGRARPDVVHLLPDGRVFSRRCIAKIRAGERGREYAAAQLVAAGASPVEGDPREWLARELPRVTRRERHPGNLKYVFALDPAVRAAVGEGLPYVKLCDLGLCDGARMHRPTCGRAAA